MARAVEELRFARKMLTDLINAIPEDKLCAQCTPADNHALWTMGHMASSYRWFSGLIGAKPSDVPQEYDTLFGYKSTPGPDASAYPSAAEIRRHFTDSFETFVRARKHSPMRRPPRPARPTRWASPRTNSRRSTALRGTRGGTPGS